MEKEEMLREQKHKMQKMKQKLKSQNHKYNKLHVMLKDTEQDNLQLLYYNSTLLKHF